MKKITHLNLKVISFIIFFGLIVATNNLIIPKNIFYLFLKLFLLIPTVALIINIFNLIPKNLLSPLLKILGILALIVLIIIIYLSSKRSLIILESYLKSGIAFLAYLYLNF